MESPNWWIAMIKVAVYCASASLCLSNALSDVSWNLRKRRCGEVSGSCEATTSRVGSRLRSFILIVFGIASSAVAWYHVSTFMAEDRVKFESFEVWVRDADWFVQSFRMMTATPQQWFFSSQLLQGLSSVMVMTYVASIRRGRIRGFSSFWLGCTVGFALSTSLLWAAVFNTPADVAVRRFYVRLNVCLVICAVGTSVLTTLLPRVAERYFGGYLVIVHFLLIAPLAVQQLWPSKFEPTAKTCAPSPILQVTRRRLVLHGLASLWVAGTYFVLAGLALMAHINNVIEAVATASDARHAVDLLGDAVCINRCQCSVSANVIAMTVLSMAVFLYRIGGISRSQGLWLALATPVASFSATLPAYLALREISLIQRRGAVAEKMAQAPPSAAANAAPATLAADAFAKTRFIRSYSSLSDVMNPTALTPQKTPPQCAAPPPRDGPAEADAGDETCDAEDVRRRAPSEVAGGAAEDRAHSQLRKRRVQAS